MRVNKILSNFGYCSRTEANLWIDQGRLTIDGKRCARGQWTWPENEIRLDGKPLERQPERFLMYYKPRGVESTMHDGEAAIHRVLQLPFYVFPVGRLDKDSEGLLLLTNAGDLAHKLIHAEEAHEKRYLVWVDKPINEDFVQQMSGGLEIKGQMTRPCQVTQVTALHFEIVLTQGLNRQIRRMCQSLGYKVQRLKRVSLGVLRLGDMVPGDLRALEASEIEALRASLEL